MATSSYYNNTLYPLQDKVLNQISKLKTPFYLTGGTALSRCYLNHRYSDDLDLFVNQDPNFLKLSAKIISSLQNSQKIKVVTRTPDYTSIIANDILKIDLINDVQSRYGQTRKTDIFPKVDNLKNILSNKLSALISRDEAKDVVDIWAITKNIKVNWKDVFLSANSKAVGIFPPTIAKRLDSFPTKLLSQIKWIDNQPSTTSFKADIRSICRSILSTS